jgi:hypothetical protein
MWRSHRGLPRANSSGFWRVTRGFCCQTAYTPRPRSTPGTSAHWPHRREQWRPAGADGMVVACPDDLARIAAIGQTLGESFPGQTFTTG